MTSLLPSPSSTKLRFNYTDKALIRQLLLGFKADPSKAYAAHELATLIGCSLAYASERLRALPDKLAASHYPLSLDIRHRHTAPTLYRFILAPTAQAA